MTTDRIPTRTEQTQSLKNRVKAAKENMPTNWRMIFISKHPEYDNMYGLCKMNNCFRFRSTDEKITAIFEEIAADAVEKKTNAA